MGYKNVKFEQEGSRLWKKGYFASSKRQRKQHIWQMQQISLLPKYTTC